MSMGLTNYVIFGIKMTVEDLDEDYEKIEDAGLDVIQFEDIDEVVVGMRVSRISYQAKDTIKELITPLPQDVVAKLQQCGICTSPEKIKLYHCGVWG